MLVAFFESLKYVGHIYPVAFMRICIGYFYLQAALEKTSSAYLVQPGLAEQINENLNRGVAPIWYQYFLQNVVDFNNNWQFIAYTVTYLEFVIAISFLIGFMVRPIGLLGFFLCLNGIYISPPDAAVTYQILMLVLFTLVWIGGGRCLGFDYFFYKRQRGIWW